MMINLSRKKVNVVLVNDVVNVGMIILGLSVGIGLILILLSIHTGSNNGVLSMNIDGPMFAAGLIIAVVGAVIGVFVAKELEE